VEVTLLCEQTNRWTDALSPAVYDEHFQRLSGVTVRSLRHALGKEPGEAVLELELESFRRETRNGTVTTRERRMEFLQAEDAPVHMDQMVWVGMPIDRRHVLILFCGRVTDCEAEFSGKTGRSMERVRVVARDARHDLAGRQVLGRYYHDAEEGRLGVDLPAVMNPEGVGNRDSAHTWQEGGSTPLFSETGNESAAWRGSDALAYLVGHYGEGLNLEVSEEGVQTETLRMELGELNLEGDSCAKAIWKVLRLAGLEGWVDPLVVSGMKMSDIGNLRAFLRLVNPSSAPVRDAKLASAGGPFTSATSEVNEGAMSWSARHIRNAWHVRGALKEYEARFELVKLWTDEEETTVEDNANKGRRGHAVYDATLDPVWRQWGLNEDGHWSERATYDFSGLFAGAVARRRRFEPPFRSAGDEVRPMVVEVQSALLGAGWYRVGNAAVRVLSDRAGIYFDCEDVDGSRSGLLAGTSRTFVPLNEISGVRVTAVVESDERVAVSSDRTDASPTELVLEHTVTDESYHWTCRDSSSLYSADGTGVIEDDSGEDGPMVRRATALREQHQGAEVGSQLNIPWVDLSWRPGVRVSQLAGRNIALRASGGEHASYPLVAGVEWDFAEQRTTLTLLSASELGRSGRRGT